MISTILWWTSVLCFVHHVASDTHPGFKTRITTAGLNYADSVAINIVSKLVIGQKIPDQSGSEGPIHYSLTGLHVTNFDKPTTSVSLAPPSGLKWHGENAVLGMHGNFHWSLLVSDSGSFDVSVHGVSFNIGVALSTDSNGRPHIKSTGCSCSIGSISITFHGDVLSQILNLFKSLIESSIKSNMQGVMCSAINSAINNDAEKALSTLPVTVDIAGIYKLDYRLLMNPVFSSKYMETFHKGEMYWEKNSTEAPFIAPDLPDYNGTSKMMYVWASDYIINTMTYQAQQHGALVYNLTANDLPAANRSVLNTTCAHLFSLCLGNFIPALAKDYPDSAVELHMSSKPAPVLSVVNQQLNAKMGGLINVYAKSFKTKQLSPLLFILNTTAAATANVFLRNETVYAKIDNLDINCTVIKAALKDVISTKALQFIIDNAIKLFVEPELNGLGAKGLPIPVTEGISFINSTLIYLKDTLLVATDLHYNPSSSVMPLSSWSQKLAQLRHSKGIIRQRRVKDSQNVFVFNQK